jgi:hypothetical protein
MGCSDCGSKHPCDEGSVTLQLWLRWQFEVLADQRELFVAPRDRAALAPIVSVV